MKNKNLLKKVLILGGALLVLGACSPEKDESDVRRKKGNITEARCNEEAANPQALDTNQANVQVEEGDVVVAEEENEEVAVDSSAAEEVSAPEISSPVAAAPAIDSTETPEPVVDVENKEAPESE